MFVGFPFESENLPDTRERIFFLQKMRHKTCRQLLHEVYRCIVLINNSQKHGTDTASTLMKKSDRLAHPLDSLDSTRLLQSTTTVRLQFWEMENDCLMNTNGDLPGTTGTIFLFHRIFSYSLTVLKKVKKGAKHIRSCPRKMQPKQHMHACNRRGFS